MNRVTLMAIRKVYGFSINPNSIIKVAHSPVLCPHVPDIELYTNNCELPSSIEFDDRVVYLGRYALDMIGYQMAIIGQCPKCHKVYYME